MASYQIISAKEYVDSFAQPFILPVFGTQWGDESKGATVALLMDHFDLFLRAMGGPNAGHSFNHGGKEYALHQIPSGIVAAAERQGVKCGLAQGMVIDPYKLLREELGPLRRDGLELDGKIVIDGGANIVIPQAIVTELIREEVQGIGTTLCGIGPTYVAEADRSAIKVDTLLDRTQLHARLQSRSDDLDNLIRGSALQGEASALRNTLTSKVVGSSRFSDGLKELLLLALGHNGAIAALEEQLYQFGQEMAPMVGSVRRLVDEAHRDGKNALCEMAQGTMLDVNHGASPFTTSTNTTALSAPVHLGAPSSWFGQPLGVAKWYMSKVGGGAFPTAYIDNERLKQKNYLKSTAMKQSDALAALPTLDPDDVDALDRHLRDATGNYGTTTGRPRMGGRFDAVVTGYAAQLNGATLFLCMLDMAALNPDRRFAAEYQYNGPRRQASGHEYSSGCLVTQKNFLAEDEFLSHCEPIYRRLEATGSDIRQGDIDAVREGKITRTLANLLSTVEESTGAAISGIRFGPQKEDSCFVRRDG